MSGFITALTDSTNGLTSATFWGELTPIVPLLVIIVPFAFGYRILRRNVKGASKGNVRM